MLFDNRNDELSGGNRSARASALADGRASRSYTDRHVPACRSQVPRLGERSVLMRGGIRCWIHAMRDLIVGYGVDMYIWREPLRIAHSVVVPWSIRADCPNAFSRLRCGYFIHSNMSQHFPSPHRTATTTSERQKHETLLPARQFNASTVLYLSCNHEFNIIVEEFTGIVDLTCKYSTVKYSTVHRQRVTSTRIRLLRRNITSALLTTLSLSSISLPIMYKH